MSISLKEAVSSTMSTAMQRIGNPVFGAFAISWCAFNWKQILYLLFSDLPISWRIYYISEISDWGTAILYPIFSTALLCFGLPWVNLLIAKLQTKPLSGSNEIEHKKRIERIHQDRDERIEEARRDVAYDSVKTGAEKEIQDMKEEITESKDRAGILTKELDEKNAELLELRGTIANLDILLKETENHNYRLKSELQESLLELSNYRTNNKVSGFESFNLKGLNGLNGLNDKDNNEINRARALFNEAAKKLEDNKKNQK